MWMNIKKKVEKKVQKYTKIICEEREKKKKRHILNLTKYMWGKKRHENNTGNRENSYEEIFHKYYGKIFFTEDVMQQRTLWLD